MATQQQQQNSTFIDDNLDTCPSLLNLPESPILPPKHRQYQQQRQRQNQDNNNNNNNIDGNKPSADANVAVTKTTTHMAPQQQQQYRQKQHGIGQHTVPNRQHRHRSISLYGVNSTVEQGHKEIPIWLDDDEPRYVSGVTNKTTCNDIIKALIDDELSNGNTNNNNNNINKIDNNNKLDGGDGVAAASRDYSDYVITERWRGIERSYDGNMAILPVWRAWSRVHNELRLSLKLRGQMKEPQSLQLIQIAPNTSNNFSMLNWIKKLLHLSNKKHKSNKLSAKTPAKLTKKTKQKYLMAKKRYEMPDELLLVILPDQHYEVPQPNAHNAKDKLYKLAETRATQRRRRRGRQEATFQTAINTNVNNNANNNCIRRRRKDVPLRQSVRNKLAALHADMNVRYEREYNLTRELTEKCKLYKLQNERYTCQEIELSVGQLQQNIEDNAQDIIRTENELLELKNEIKHDISLINNLKRMTLEQDIETKSTSTTNAAKNSCGMPIMKTVEETPQVAKNAEEMQFVDNIYEFCDNNASMLV